MTVKYDPLGGMTQPQANAVNNRSDSESVSADDDFTDITVSNNPVAPEEVPGQGGVVGTFRVSVVTRDVVTKTVVVVGCYIPYVNPAAGSATSTYVWFLEISDDNGATWTVIRRNRSVTMAVGSHSELDYIHLNGVAYRFQPNTRYTYRVTYYATGAGADLLMEGAAFSPRTLAAWIHHF